MQLHNLTDPVWLVLGALATWRITSIILYERIFNSFRVLVEKRFTKDGLVGYFFSCFWCFSVWVGATVSLLIIFCPYLLVPFGLSAVSIFLQRSMECIDE